MYFLHASILVLIFLSLIHRSHYFPKTTNIIHYASSTIKLHTTSTQQHAKHKVGYFNPVVYNSELPLIDPRREAGMSDVSPLSEISGLSFDSTLLSPLLFFCRVLRLFLSYLFFCLLAHSPEPFFRRFFNIFR